MHNTSHRTSTRGVVAGLLALTLLGSVPGSAAAETPSMADLQARIAALQASIAALQGNPTTNLAPYTWRTTLRLGATGEDVRELQRFLNSDPDTRVAASGIGSPGNESTYFGPATAAAVSRFQVKYRSDILSPSGLVNPTGIFGPATIAKANALRAGAVVVLPPTPKPNPSNPQTPTKPELRGEGQLDSFELDEADRTDIKEAAGDVAIGTIRLEATDGDININRLDLSLTANSANLDRAPWDTFESISLFVDDEKIAERRIDRKTDYQDRRLGTIRFTNLDLIAEEDEEMKITVAVSVQNNIRGAGSSADWNLTARALRYFDADQVATDDRTTGDLGDSVDFAIVTRSDGEELKFSLSRSNPDAQTIVVDTDKATNNVTILSYDIEALDADITLDTLAVNIETGTAAYADVVKAVRLIIGNKTFRSDSISTTGAYSTTSVLATFDINEKVTIDSEDSETVRVVVDLKPMTAYQSDETITARVTSQERDTTEAEGSDDIETFSGSAIGKVHQLITEGVTANTDNVRFNLKTLGQNSTTGEFTIEFAVTAVEGDFYINSYASTSAGTTTGGVRYSVEGPAGLDTLSAVLTASADEETPDVFVVREGETETFTLLVVVDPSSAGQYRVGLESITFSSDTDGITNSETRTLNPTNKYRSPYQFINN